MYFLIGMDAFKDISTWRQPEELLAEVEFIVVSRPGYSLADVGRALPRISASNGLDAARHAPAAEPKEPSL